MFSRRQSVALFSGASGRLLKLDGKERKIIQSTWATVSDRGVLGRHIMRQIFAENPSLKLLFNLKLDVDNDALIQDEDLLPHADVFGMFLHVAVTHMLDGSNEALIELVYQVGAAHATFEKVRFDAEYWLLFKSAVMDQLEPHYAIAKCTSEIARSAWDPFLMFLIMEMKTSFNQTILRQHNEPELVKQLHSRLLKNYHQCQVPAAEMDYLFINKANNAIIARFTDPLPRRCPESGLRRMTRKYLGRGDFSDFKSEGENYASAKTERRFLGKTLGSIGGFLRRRRQRTTSEMDDG